MHIRFLAVAGMMCLLQAHAADPVIPTPKPALPVGNAATATPAPTLPAEPGGMARIETSRPAVAPRKAAAVATGAGDSEEADIQRLAERITARLANLRETREARRQAGARNGNGSASATAPRSATNTRSTQNIRPAPSRQAARTASGKTAARAAEDKPAAARAPRQWRYEGEGGPAQWARMHPDWHACGEGERQSPIDIRDGLRVDLEPVQFDYRPSRFSVLDNGHTIQVNPARGNVITTGGRSYELVQFHFHLPSEERINGRGYPMVLHLVHKDAHGRYVVVALLADEGGQHGVVQQVWNNLPLERHDTAMASVPMDLAGLLPERRDYYTYMGSMTTPPCTEGVQWIVMKEPIRLSGAQISLFARLYPMNARPIQAHAGRRIMESN